MELWDWNMANKHLCSQLAKLLHGQKVPVTWAKNLLQCSSLKMSWATTTRSLWKCKLRMENIGWSLVNTEPTAWGFDVHVWNLLPILKKAGFASIEDLPKTAVGFSSKAYKNLPPKLRLSTTSNGEQRVRVFVPNEQKLHHTTQFLMQDYPNLVDWKVLKLPLKERR